MGLTREDAFHILELPVGADYGSIRTSYKRLALTWHPDKHKNSAEANMRFQHVTAAYRKLTEEDYDSDDDMTMTMDDMRELFRQMFVASMTSAYSMNGYDSSDYDEDDEDYDDEDLEYMGTLSDNYMKRDYNTLKLDSNRKHLSPEEIEKNAKELITEEEKEKRKAEKRRAKKKRRREKKKLEKQEQAKVEEKKENKKAVNGKVHTEPAETKKKKDKKKGSGSEEEATDFDQNAAFFTKVVNKKKKAGVLPEAQANNKGKQKSSQGKSEEEGEELDPIVLRSRQLAIRGNEMANSGHYQAAIDLFTEAIKLDPRDFRFFGNRSYCFDRIQQYDRALRDADKAISLAQDWPKGYFRKGRALAGLKLYADAEQAFMQVLKLDRNCEDAMTELLRVRTHQLTEMGFSKQQAEAAIRQFGSVQTALDSLLAGVAENSLSGDVYMSDDEDTVVPHTLNTAPVSQPIVQQPVPTASHVTTSNTTPLQINHKPGDTKMDPTNPEGLTALWVGNVLPEVNEKKLQTMFSKFGTVTSVRCLPDKYCAFINYKSKEAAGRAMHGLQGVECAGQRLLIKFPDNPIVNGNVVIRKTGAVPVPTSKPQPPQTQQNFSSSKDSALKTNREHEEKDLKVTGPVNGDECYFWRTTGCTFGKECHYKHNPQSKGVDRKPWQKV